MLRVLLLGGVLLILAACGGTTNPPTSQPAAPTATSRFPTVVGVQRATLPPSWTPTFTPTVTFTPTIIPTPTITVTPSITPTLTTDQLCENFTGSVIVIEGFDYRETSYIDYFLGSSLPDMYARIYAYNETTQEERILDLPGGQVFIGKLSLKALSGPGDYTLTISGNTETETGLCAQSYQFTIQPESFFDRLEAVLATLAANPTETPQSSNSDN